MVVRPYVHTPICTQVSLEFLANIVLVVCKLAILAFSPRQMQKWYCGATSERHFAESVHQRTEAPRPYARDTVVPGPCARGMMPHKHGPGSSLCRTDQTGSVRAPRAQTSELSAPSVWTRRHRAPSVRMRCLFLHLTRRKG